MRAQTCVNSAVVVMGSIAEASLTRSVLVMAIDFAHDPEKHVLD